MALHSFIYTLSRVIPAIIAFLSVSLFTHLMSPEDYGMYSLVYHAALISSGILLSWLGTSSLRYWNREGFDQQHIISTIYSSYLLILLIIIVALTIAHLILDDMLKLLISSFVLISAVALQYITQNLFNARQNALNYAIVTIISSICSFAFAGLMAYNKMPVNQIILAAAIGIMLPSIIFGFKDWSSFRFKNISFRINKKFLIYGLPVSFAALVEEITNSIDRYMIAGLVGIGESGKYGASYDLSGNSIFMIMFALNLAAYPMIISNFEKKGLDDVKLSMQKYIQVLLAIALPALVGLNLISINLVYLVIGEEFQTSVLIILPWVSSALFAMGLQMFYFDYKFQIQEKTKIILYIGIFTAVSNLALNWYLIPVYGMLGAAYATLICMLFSTFLSIILGHRMMPIKLPLQKILHILVATAIMAISIYWMKDQYTGWWWLTLQMLIAIVSYTLAAISMNILDARTLIANYFDTTNSDDQAIKSQPK